MYMEYTETTQENQVYSDELLDMKFKASGGYPAHFGMIPHIVDDMPLSVYAYRLYARFVRRVLMNSDGSTSGQAYDSTSTLAEELDMSKGMVTKAKRELAAAGLIRIRKREGWHGEFPGHSIEIVNIWEENEYYFSDCFWVVVRDGPDDTEGRLLIGKDARKQLKEWGYSQNKIEEWKGIKTFNRWIFGNTHKYTPRKGCAVYRKQITEH